MGEPLNSRLVLSSQEEAGLWILAHSVPLLDTLLPFQLSHFWEFLGPLEPPQPHMTPASTLTVVCPQILYLWTLLRVAT